jgi:hypothetical protein
MEQTLNLTKLETLIKYRKPKQQKKMINKFQIFFRCMIIK